MTMQEWGCVGATLDNRDVMGHAQVWCFRNF